MTFGKGIDRGLHDTSVCCAVIIGRVPHGTKIDGGFEGAHREEGTDRSAAAAHLSRPAALHPSRSQSEPP